jgi:hypothetical protein
MPDLLCGSGITFLYFFGGFSMSDHPKRYHLEVYAGAAEHPMVSFVSDQPFLTISVGDTFETRAWEGASDTPWEGPGSGRAVRVTKVEHIIWNSPGGHVSHKLMVETEPVK